MFFPRTDSPLPIFSLCSPTTICGKFEKAMKYKANGQFTKAHTFKMLHIFQQQGSKDLQEELDYLFDSAPQRDAPSLIQEDLKNPSRKDETKK